MISIVEYNPRIAHYSPDVLQYVGPTDYDLFPYESAFAEFTPEIEAELACGRCAIIRSTHKDPGFVEDDILRLERISEVLAYTNHYLSKDDDYHCFVFLLDDIDGDETRKLISDGHVLFLDETPESSEFNPLFTRKQFRICSVGDTDADDYWQYAGSEIPDEFALDAANASICSSARLLASEADKLFSIIHKLASTPKGSWSKVYSYSRRWSSPMTLSLLEALCVDTLPSDAKEMISKALDDPQLPETSGFHYYKAFNAHPFYKSRTYALDRITLAQLAWITMQEHLFEMNERYVYGLAEATAEIADTNGLKKIDESKLTVGIAWLGDELGIDLICDAADKGVPFEAL